MQEVWKPIIGYEGLYEVSDMGRVRRLTQRNKVCNRAYVYPRILKPCSHSKGYKQVTLSRNGVSLSRSIHRLVLEAFIGERDGMQGAHLNGVQSDNRLKNLKWVTQAENELHKVSHGKSVIGEKSPNAKLTEKSVILMRNMRNAGCAVKTLVDIFGVSDTNVRLILSRKAWNHV